jgi:hypothetical protein
MRNMHRMLCWTSAGVLACGGGAEQAADTSWTVDAKGFGPIRLGTPVAAVERALADTLRVTYERGGSCAYVTPLALPAGARLMVVADTVVRVDVDSASITTLEGARVGDSESHIRTLYDGRVRVQPHEYTDGHYLVVPALEDSTFQIIFETDGARVVRYRAGRLPAVGWVEGCS